jgi:hypothetical protein
METASFRMTTAEDHMSSLSVILPEALINAIATCTVHRDEGPSVVVIKCNSFKSAEVVGQMIVDAKQFIVESEV